MHIRSVYMDKQSFTSTSTNGKIKSFYFGIYLTLVFNRNLFFRISSGNGIFVTARRSRAGSASPSPASGTPTRTATATLQSVLPTAVLEEREPYSYIAVRGLELERNQIR